ncbi:MAG: glycosyltransferase family 2 protein [Nitrososphaerota archaeon]|nr:glycosyltransferase family 2 protein [Nitrososphaerota archaeon]
MNNTLGICIPTFNRSSLLKECLLSLIPQFSEFEFPIYVSDNASTDDTEEVVRIFQASYPNITYNRNKRNEGLYQNILFCLKMAKTDYVWLMGDDDKLLQDSLHYVIDHIRRGMDFLILNSIVYDKNMESIIRKKAIKANSDIFYPPGSHQDLLCDLRFAHYHGFMSAMVIRRDLILLHVDEFQSSESKYFGNIWLPLMLFYRAIIGKQGIFLSEPLVMNRDNCRPIDKNFWDYIVGDHLRAIDSLPRDQYDQRHLRKAEKPSLFGILAFGILARTDPQHRLFSPDFRDSRLINAQTKLAIFVADKLPSKCIPGLQLVISRFRGKTL